MLTRYRALEEPLKDKIFERYDRSSRLSQHWDPYVLGCLAEISGACWEAV